MPKVVEILFIAGCPNVEPTRQALFAAIRAANTEHIDIREIEVLDAEHANALGFRGSPTVRVDGSDVEGPPSEHTAFGLQCRVYHVDGKIVGAPPAAWIERHLRCPAK